MEGSNRGSRKKRQKNAKKAAKKAAKEAAKVAAKETAKETALRMIKDGELPLEKIALYIPELSLEELKTLKTGNN